MWQASDSKIWQGRDDSRESPTAKRVFQTIHSLQTWQPEQTAQHVALLGFASDVGVARNLGRVGAAKAPPVLRQALANMASQTSAYPLLDAGDIHYPDGDLDAAQNEFAQAVQAIHAHQGKTLVLGGGHETAFAHGSGLYAAYPDQRIAIINFDPHLDLRRHHQATSGTPFAQLAQLAHTQNRPFDYTCIGASGAANTAALLQDAEHLGVNIVWDTDIHWGNVNAVLSHIEQVLSRADIVYLTIDLDVLPSYQMPAVSAPAALGIALDLLIHLITPILQSGRLVGADVAEFNPDFDIDKQGARVAARLLWHIWQTWR
ncbi:formimidoylglutamase [Vitreoscilla stercoraria]|uniref:Formimidoylglutamase n=1 Tax=Vitreoscilla stercoraria TaxID=61 RepID=A0ABY4E6S5_VITST|nr:formimidoylglutamase [Vitreoscilla stercoraria]UOO91478.1 formimidoylglutamase [Vitreoscilla stercoraria]